MGNNEKVFILDNEPVIRDSLRFLLEAFDHEVVGEAGSLRELRQTLTVHRDLNPSVFVVDHNLGGEETGEVAAEFIHETRDGAKTISISTFKQDYCHINLTKQTPADEIIRVINEL